MALDPGIYGQIGQGVRSVADYDAIAQGQQANKLALLMNQAKYDEYNRGLQDQTALRDATKGFGADSTANYNRLLGIGNLKAAQDYQKNIDDQKLTRVKTKQEETQTAGFAQDQAIKATGQHLQSLAMVNDPQQFAQWADAGRKSGVFTEEQYQRGIQALQNVRDPQAFEQLKQQALAGGASALEQLKMKADAEKAAEIARHNVSTEGLTKRGQDVSAATQMRGQNMTDARSRESTVATMTKPFEVTGPDGAPMLVQQDKQGNITPVQGFGPKTGASKPLNDTQAKALLFGTRMQEADKILQGLDGKYSPTAINTKVGAENIGGFTGAIAGSLGNAMLSEPNQQAEQAQRDFINAVLRRESGAAIAPSEFTNAQKQYFDQPNDQPGTRAQKARNRQIAIKGLLAEVPQGQRGAIDVSQGQAPAAPAAAPVQTATNPQTGQKIMLVNGQWVPAK